MAWKLPLDHQRKFQLFDLQREHQQHQKHGWFPKCFILVVREKVQQMQQSSRSSDDR